MPRRAKIRPDDPGPERIRRAAARLFAERGFEATSIADIGAGADIAKSLLYHHFQSKSQLYEDVLTEATHELISRVKTAAAQGDSPFSDGIDAYLLFIGEFPAEGRLLLREPPADPRLAAVHARMNALRQQTLEEILATPQKRRNERAHIGLAAVAIRTYALWWLEHPDISQSEIRDAITATLQAAPPRAKS